MAITNVRESPATDARCTINATSLVIFTTGAAALEGPEQFASEQFVN